jgi:hypothetical protein
MQKIPRIECILNIPEINNEIIIKILNNNKNLGKSLKILKKKKKRIMLNNYINKIEELKLIIKKINIFNDLKDYNKLNDYLKNIKIEDFNIISNYIVKNIDNILNKYLKILIHRDDQIYIISKINNDTKKIFLKFFFPKIKCLLNEKKDFDNNINSNKDNIHATILPTLINHGIDGIFHLTFRLEGKYKSLFEYSKYCSINIDCNKLGVLLYEDEKCLESIIFKITNNLKKLLENIKNNELIDDKIFDKESYEDLLEYISSEIINKLINENKIILFLERYLYSFGKNTIKTIIDKLLKIIILTFLELSL